MAWNDNNQQSTGKKNKPENGFNFGEILNGFKQKYQQDYKHYLRDLPVRKLLNYSSAGLVIAWLCSGIYIIDQGNRGVVTRFDAYASTTMPGPHWHWPLPIENVANVNVENQRFIEVGYRSGASRRINSGSVLPEALMLTKDENIINVSLAVQYQIKNAKDYLFNVKANEDTLKQVTESVQRGVIGKNSMDYILTEGRSQVVFDIKDEMQKAMDIYGTGILVTSVNLQDAQPPEEVQNAFEDAIRAREDKQRLINEAQAYANEVIPKARGASARMLQEAEGYEAKVVERAKGEADRFDQLSIEYEKAPAITRKRLYLESKEQLYKKSNKVLVNVENGNNMFYIPLNQLPQGNSHSANNHQMGDQSSSHETKSEIKPLTRTNSGIRTSRSKQ